MALHPRHSPSRHSAVGQSHSPSPLQSTKSPFALTGGAGHRYSGYSRRRIPPGFRDSVSAAIGCDALHASFHRVTGIGDTESARSTGTVIGGMLASRCRVATVHRAGDSIVVALGTGIGVHTSLGRVAGVPGTQVPVVAVGSHTAHAHGVGAGIRCGAGIPVVASQGIRKIGAARGDVTGVACADIPIVAVHTCSRLTGGRQARIALCASIAVVARRGVRSRIEATAVRVTGIIGAGVAVVAIGSRTPTQTVAAQVSPVVQASPSEHGAVFAAFTQPVWASHESSVHELSSLQSTTVPPHTPERQVSALVQASPSSQADPVSPPRVHPVSTLQLVDVHGSPSSQFTAAP